MADRYNNFLELAKKETQGIDFRVRLQHRAGKAIVLAPHGGGIEPGTSEIAEAIAGADLSFYAFEGIKPADNRILHITSTRFDEPQGKVLAEALPTVIAVHGEEADVELWVRHRHASHQRNNEAPSAMNLNFLNLTSNEYLIEGSSFFGARRRHAREVRNQPTSTR